MHVFCRRKPRGALEATSSKPRPHFVGQLTARVVSISKCGATAVQLGQEQLEGTTARRVFFHLGSRPLRVVRRVDLELFAEATFQLEPVLELEDFGGFDVLQTAEAGVLARSAPL